MKHQKLFITNGSAARDLRKRLGLNQFDFWHKLGVTQSAGSRYESGREISEPVQLLLHIAYAPEKSVAGIIDFLRGHAQKLASAGIL